MTLMYFLAVIVLLVGIHEWGHFAVARLFGVGVRSFTIGFGKQFVSWVDPKTGTSWGLAPFPLGGYVGLLGEKTEADANDKTATFVAGKPFIVAPLYARLLILLAGPTINLFFAALLYAVLAYTAPPQAVPMLASPPMGSSAQIAGLQSGDQVIAVNEQTLRHWRDLQMALVGRASGDEIQLKLASGSLRILKVPNPAAVEKQNSAEEMLGLRLASQGLLVQEVSAQSPAQLSGLRSGDRVETVNGTPIDHPAVLLSAIQASKGEAVLLGVRRQSEVAANAVMATATVLPSKDPQGVYKIGLKFAGQPYLSEQGMSLIEAVQDGFFTAYTASVLTLKALGSFLVKPFASDQLAGPIGIAQSAKDSTDKGWASALAFVAGLSISVGMLNLLPIPLLDGGQIVYHLLRDCALALRIPFKINVVNKLSYFWSSIGVAFVLGLTLLAFYTDLKRFF